MMTKQQFQSYMDAAGRYGIPIVVCVWLLLCVTSLGFYFLPDVKDYLKSQTALNVETKNALAFVIKSQDALRLEYASHEADHVKASLLVADLMKQNLESVKANGTKIAEGNDLLQKTIGALREMVDAIKEVPKNEQKLPP